MAQSRRQWTNPIENIHSYIMQKAGIQRDERLADLEWVRDKLKAGDELARCASQQTEQSSELVQAIKGWREI